MDLYDLQAFEERWNRFELRIRMKLSPLFQKEVPTLAVANIALRQASENWLTQYDVDGKWLCDISADSPDKAAIIAEILKKDLRFSEQVENLAFSKIILFGVPILSGVVGLGISSWLQWAALAKAAATLLPAALVYPAVASLTKDSDEKNTADAITKYIRQLDCYKSAIMSALTGGVA